MAKWEIPDNRDRKLMQELREALELYVETDETPEDDPSYLGECKRKALAVLAKIRAR